MDDRGGGACQLEAGEHLRVLQRRKWAIVAATMVMVAPGSGVGELR